MSLFAYSALDAQGIERTGTIDAVNIDLAIGALQRRGLIISKINAAEAAKSVFDIKINIFDRVTNADIVMTSRQITTLFQAQVSTLRAFRLLASEARTSTLAARLSSIADDIQGGSSIANALSKHPDLFSNFYVNMVRAGEESGKLDETFTYLADHLDRNYELMSKAKNALIYPAFIMLTFVVVMVLMLTIVIPHLAVMLDQVGQQVPIYTRIVIGLSNFLTHYIFLVIAMVLGGGFFLYQFGTTERGQLLYARARLETPAVGSIFQKLFLSRVADNLSTMLRSGIQILRGLEITASVVEDPVYQKILTEAANDVKGGLPLSEAFRKHPEFPGIVVAMIKIGEETGNMGNILETMAKFYRREVDNAVDTLVSLIEPVMIVALAVGVAFLLASVLLPIYNVASSF